MKIFIAGGTGLLGSASAAELISRGHKVHSVALPPIPENANIPEEMELTLGNFLTMTDDELRAAFKDCDGFVFAAGVDERIEFPAPVMEYYMKFNVKPVKRMLKFAKLSGVKRVVVLGSYFAYFAKKWPDLQLAVKHPYIRSRIIQEEVAMTFNGNGMDVMILELPYIFGAQPGRKPVWTFLVEIIKNMKFVTLYPKGGTTMVIVRQVAQAVAGALENGKGGVCYPVGWFNLSWKEMLAIFHKYMNMPQRKVITIPAFLFRMKAKQIMKELTSKGVESGLDLVSFSKIQTANTFIDKNIIENKLRVTDDDIDAAIGDSVKLCIEVLSGQTDLITMRGE